MQLKILYRKAHISNECFKYSPRRISAIASSLKYPRGKFCDIFVFLHYYFERNIKHFRWNIQSCKQYNETIENFSIFT